MKKPWQEKKALSFFCKKSFQKAVEKSQNNSEEKKHRPNDFQKPTSPLFENHQKVLARFSAVQRKKRQARSSLLRGGAAPPNPPENAAAVGGTPPTP